MRMTTPNVDNVNMEDTRPTLPAAADRTYHHGDLRNALIEAGLKALEHQEAGELSLRALARELGVSANAVAQAAAWALPFSVRALSLLEPWMRPSAFQVLCPWRTSTTLCRWVSASAGGGASTRSLSGEKASNQTACARWRRLLGA